MRCREQISQVQGLYTPKEVGSYPNHSGKSKIVFVERAPVILYSSLDYHTGVLGGNIRKKGKRRDELGTT